MKRPPPVGDGQAVLKYLAPYVNRVVVTKLLATGASPNEKRFVILWMILSPWLVPAFRHVRPLVTM